MARYSLVFGYRDLISGNGFVAGVAADGRALLVEEEDAFWVYGVNPGGIAASGATRETAVHEFRAVHRSALFDLAIGAPDFKTFKQEVEAFFQETNRATEADWIDATHEIANGTAGADWLPTVKAKSHPPVIRIEEVSRKGPSVNALDQEPMAAVA